MGKIADSVIIINIIKVSFKWIQVSCNSVGVASGSFITVLRQGGKKQNKTQVITIDQLFEQKSCLWVMLRENISQGKTCGEPHSVPNLPLFISRSLFFSQQQSDFQTATAVEITLTQLSLLIYDIRLVIYWLIMAGCWEQVRVHLQKITGPALDREMNRQGCCLAFSVTIIRATDLTLNEWMKERRLI